MAAILVVSSALVGIFAKQSPGLFARELSAANDLSRKYRLDRHVVTYALRECGGNVRNAETFLVGTFIKNT